MRQYPGNVGQGGDIFVATAHEPSASARLSDNTEGHFENDLKSVVVAVTTPQSNSIYPLQMVLFKSGDQYVNVQVF